MAQPTRKPPAKVDASVLDPLGVWPIMLAESARMQKLQWDALSAWQQNFALFNKDFWEQWACRYAGGIPIDA
jgi:hypothetical protein